MSRCQTGQAGVGRLSRINCVPHLFKVSCRFRRNLFSSLQILPQKVAQAQVLQFTRRCCSLCLLHFRAEHLGLLPAQGKIGCNLRIPAHHKLL